MNTLRVALEGRGTRVPDDFLVALVHLANVANRSDSGQVCRVRRFLLGLYNGREWPFDLTELRCLDDELQQCCLTVLKTDIRPAREVHRYLERGDDLFSRWWAWEVGARDRELRGVLGIDGEGADQ